MQHARKLGYMNRPDTITQPNSKPVARPLPGSLLKKVKLLSILLTCFVLSITVVAQYSSMVVMNYQLSSTRTELAEVREATRLLELEAAQLGTIGRIEQVARDELGMVDPELNQLKVVSANREIVNRQGE
ncbi:MAG: cell division protein FtsL [Bacillota bacterium]